MKTRKIIAGLQIAIGFLIAFIAMGMLEQGAATAEAYTVEFIGLVVSIIGMLWMEALERKK